MVKIDIEMPEECDECMFCINKTNNDYGYFGQCFVQDNLKVNLLMHKRTKWCPLIKEN